MNIFEQIDRYIHKIETFFVGNFIKSNRELVFLICLVSFPIFARLIPLQLVALSFVTCFVLYVANHFYFYVNAKAQSENKNISVAQYTWGFVREYTDNLDFKTFVSFIKNKKIDFYTEYLSTNKHYIFLMVYTFGDLIVAFKNLSLEVSGAYFAMSLFTKFVFISYIFVNAANRDIKNESTAPEAAINKYLDNFYRHFSGIASVGLVLFAIFFAVGKFITELFFGFKYLEYQTSLSFILLANLALLLGLIVFKTGILVDSTRTWSIMKIFAPIFAIMFVFINISHPDTAAFFVIGSVAVVSIFIYNFAIRRPSYIENTYNFLF